MTWLQILFLLGVIYVVASITIAWIRIGRTEKQVRQIDKRRRPGE